MRILQLPLALALFTSAALAAVELKEEPSKVSVSIDGQLFTEYLFKNVPHPSFYPVNGPGGVKMTRSWPIEEAPKEEHDHVHHRSLWFAHGLVNGVDYWSEAATYGTKAPKLPIGKILHEKILEAKGGEKQGVLKSSQKWEAPDGTTTLTSVQTVTFYQTKPNERVLDFDVTMTAGEKEAVFGDTKEGTMAIRVAESMRLKPAKAFAVPGAPTGHLVNADGVKDGDVWGKRSKWVDYAGPVEGKTVGVAIFDHPKNHRYPTRWHARDYGLFAANPFAEQHMDKTLPPAEVKLAPGKSLTLKYRFYFHEGDAEQAQVAERYAEFIK